MEPSTQLQYNNVSSPDSELVPGAFDYIVDKWEKDMLRNAWRVINILEMWDFVKDVGQFSFNNEPKICIITAKMEELGYNGHSGSSFTITMRCMQHIAIYGEDAFKTKYLSSRASIDFE